MLEMGRICKLGILSMQGSKPPPAAKKTGAPVQSSLRGFVKRSVEAAKPTAGGQKNAEGNDPDLARALAASLTEPSLQPVPELGPAQGSAEFRQNGANEGQSMRIGMTGMQNFVEM